MRNIAFGFVVIGFIFMSPILCLGQTSVSDDSLQGSSEDSLQGSSEDSLQTSSEESLQSSSEDSLQTSSEESTQNSSDETTGATSEGSSQATSDGTANLENASAVTLIVGGAVVAVGLTAVGITYLVNVSGATRAGVLGFQDEIYAAAGPDFQRVVEELGVSGVELVRANDEIVAAGYAISSDQDAADYLVALMLKLAKTAA